MGHGKVGPIDIRLTATLGKVRVGDTWTWVQLPDSATLFGRADPVSGG
ncbi:MAG: hypothetical protein KBB39_07210 [Phycicoccus sp.]|nr:hypothetical protein [Phycicoccus sp.]